MPTTLLKDRQDVPGLSARRGGLLFHLPLIQH